MEKGQRETKATHCCPIELTCSLTEKELVFPRLSVPVYFSLELTPFCNNRCPGCSNVFSRRNKPLTTSQWENVIERIGPHAQVVKLTGGEPTLHPGLSDICAKLADQETPFTVFSNGRWQDTLGFIRMLRSKDKFGGLLISLHGANPLSHERFTKVQGSFAETVANIRLATDAGLPVNLSTVITRWNYQHIEEIIKLGCSLGVHEIVFNRFIGHSGHNIEPNTSQFRSTVAAIERLRKDGQPIKFGNCIPQCFARNSSGGCWASLASCTVDPWANIRPCNHSSQIMGNILTQPLQQIWTSERFIEWRTPLPSGCRHCGHLDTCRGGCLAMLEIQQTPADPLMRCPEDCKYDSRYELELPHDARPILKCRVKREWFGHLLMSNGSLFPVPEQYASLLEHLNGRTSLKDINEQFGEEGVDLVGTLLMQELAGLQGLS